MGTTLTFSKASNAGSTPEHAIYSYFDTPSTTSQITYKVGTSGDVWVLIFGTPIERWVIQMDQYERGTSFISVTEIAG